MKIIRIAAIAFGVYVVLGLVIDSAIGYFQPQRGNTTVLRTFDPDRGCKETVLSLLDERRLSPDASSGSKRAVACAGEDSTA